MASLIQFGMTLPLNACLFLVEGLGLGFPQAVVLGF